MNIIRRELRASRISLVVWSLAFIFLAYASIIKFDSIISSGPEVLGLLDNFPRVILALFNMVDVDLSTLEGYFSIVANYLMLMAGAQGLFLGIRLFAKEEQEKTADFLLSKPRSRSAIFFNKLSAGLIMVLLLQAVLFAINYLALKDYLPQAFTMLKNYSLALIIIHSLFLSLGIALSNLLPSGRAETVGLAILLANYFIPIIANMSDRFFEIKHFFPFNMFLLPSMAQPDGTPLLKLAILLVLAIALSLIGRAAFIKRDIYV